MGRCGCLDGCLKTSLPEAMLTYAIVLLPVLLSKRLLLPKNTRQSITHVTTLVLIIQLGIFKIRPRAALAAILAQILYAAYLLYKQTKNTQEIPRYTARVEQGPKQPLHYAVAIAHPQSTRVHYYP